MKIKCIVYVLLLVNIIFSQYNYSKEDLNPTSESFGQMVWEPTFQGYITLHYFTTQG